MKLSALVYTVGVLLLFSCEKEDATDGSGFCGSSQLTASCNPPEKVFVSNTKSYGSSVYHPEAKYIIDLADTVGIGPNTLFQFAFNKYPTTGLYQMLTEIDTNNISIPNQIAFVKDSGSFLYRSGWSISNTVYVDNSNNQIIVSFCDISDESVAFDQNTQTYIGIKPKTDKIRIP